MSDFAYVEDERNGESWRLLLGDSCERLSEIADNSVDLVVYSPPFASLFTYSPSERDIGNCANRTEFIDHYRYVVDELLMVVKPGRHVVVHCQQVATQKGRDGAVGLTDFRGDLIRCHIAAGMTYYGEVTVDKDPQAQAIRTKASRLMFVTLNRDSASSSPAMADYLLDFRIPGDNGVPIKPDCDNETWIEWARPVWYNVRETRTLNVEVAREDEDERHICPLQLDFVERVVRLWSNPGELVLSPFAGIGSEGYEAIRHRRRFVGIELKPSYFEVACKNLAEAEYMRDLPRLFDEDSQAVHA